MDEKTKMKKERVKKEMRHLSPKKEKIEEKENKSD